jgi:hypothetical protein
VQAVQDGKFHIYAVETIDQGIALLTGVPAGEADAEGNYPEGSVNYLVQQKLLEMAEEKAGEQEKDEDGLPSAEADQDGEDSPEEEDISE